MSTEKAQKRMALIDHPKYQMMSENFYKSMMEDYCAMFALFGIHADFNRSLEGFEAQYGPLDRYDCVVMHPGIGNQRRYILTIKERYPELRFAFFTDDLGISHYPKIKTDLRIFDCDDIEGIAAFALACDKAEPK